MRGTIEETKTLAAVAAAQLDAAADRARPCRLLATALTRHRWFEAVPVVARVAPDAIADLYDRLMNPPELLGDLLPN